MSSLYVIRGKDQGRRFDLGAEPTTIGRDRGNTIQLKDTEVSRRHAEIQLEGAKFKIVDLNSSNGTYVNSKIVGEQVLRSGDRVQIGRSVLIFTSSNLTPRDNNLSTLIDITTTDLQGEEKIVSSFESGLSETVGGMQSLDSAWESQTRKSLQIMYQTALAASHTLDIDELLNRILDLIFESVRADRGCIMLLDEDSDSLLPRATSFRNEDTPHQQVQISRTILDHVMETKHGVRTSDAGQDSRWQAGVSILKMRVREAICVPMQGRYGIVGVIYIDTFTEPGDIIENEGASTFNDEHLQLMIAISHQAALAIEDSSYYSAMVRTERLAAMGQTIATLSHHIKNILQGIQGGSYLIKEGLRTEDNEAVSHGWKMVEKNQDRISHLVMDMLSFSKDREPDLKLNCVNKLVSDVIELSKIKAKDAKVELQWKSDESIPEVLFDYEGLHRAVLNVVGNAIDACSDTETENRIVTVKTLVDTISEIVIVSVQDNGIGISPEDLESIFAVFKSGKGNRGTGLGLPVSQKIMKEHGGQITVQSELGTGTEFRLELPLARPQQTATYDPS